MSDTPIPLSKYIKLITGPNVTVQKAMELSGKVYKNFKTPNQLANLSDVDLIRAGLHAKDDRSLFMSAMHNAGYIARNPKKKEDIESTPSVPEQPSTVKKKIKRPEMKNEFSPDAPSEPYTGIADLKWEEVLDEKVLENKSTVVNRAPLMAAWAVIVAERLGFEREEALSIASVYTEMNAISKGVSLGIYDSSHKRKAPEAVKDGTQPYVEFMGRRIPLFQTKESRWWALNNGTPTPPKPTLSYILRSFRQTAPYLMGSLRLLAQSWSADALRDNAWNLYAEFRPTVTGWGRKGEVQCQSILKLRNPHKMEPTELTTQLVIKPEPIDDDIRLTEPKTKRMKYSSLEDSDLEAELGDEDFKDIDFSAVP